MKILFNGDGRERVGLEMWGGAGNVGGTGDVGLEMWGGAGELYRAGEHRNVVPVLTRASQCDPNCDRDYYS